MSLRGPLRGFHILTRAFLWPAALGKLNKMGLSSISIQEVTEIPIPYLKILEEIWNCNSLN